VGTVASTGLGIGVALLIAGLTVAGFSGLHVGYALISTGIAVMGLAVLAEVVGRRRKRPVVELHARVVRKIFLNAVGTLIGEGWVAQVEVANEPRRAAQAQAVELVPRLSFLSADGAALSIEGRWADSALPEHPDRAMPPISIPPYTRRHLDIAILFDGERGLFAVNNSQSPFGRYRVAELAVLPPAIVDIDLLGPTKHHLRVSLFVEDGRLRARSAPR
jgi:hypothetical protein